MPVELAIGTILSQPLRPAKPETNFHPLRFGWYFESLPLDGAAKLSVERRTPASLIRVPTLPDGAPA